MDLSGNGMPTPPEGRVQRSTSGSSRNRAGPRFAGSRRFRSQNVFIVLSARSVRSDLLIVARAIDEQSESKLVKAGANRVILPYQFSGRRMVTMLIRPEVANFLDEVAYGGGLELYMERFQLAPDSPLVGQTLEQCRWRARFGVTVLACKLADGGINASPTADTNLTAGLRMIVLGTRERLRSLPGLARGKLEAF